MTISNWILVIVMWTEVGHVRLDSITFISQKACNDARTVMVVSINENDRSKHPHMECFCFPVMK